jgi:hypothetical protein
VSSQSISIKKEQLKQNMEFEKIKKKGFQLVIRQNDAWKFWWDTVILILAIFNSITIPLKLSFDEFSETLDNSLTYNIVNLTSAVFFILDIFLQLNTTFYDADGEEIFDKRRIRIHYLCGMFTVDLLSSIPIEIILPNHPLRVLNILKILRIFRLTAIINKMNVDEEAKSQMRILQLIFLLMLCMHIVGSAWNAITKGNEYWIPPLDFVYAGKYPQIYRLYTKSDVYRYIVHFYNAILFLGGNEMGPRSNTELILSTVFLVCMAIFNAWLFGDMAVLSEISGRKQA